MAKIYFDTQLDKNNLVEFLKDVSQKKDEVLYGLLKDGEQEKQEEPKEKIVYKTERELHPEEHRSCANCNFTDTEKGCINPICPNVKDCIDCIQNGHKYWRGKK